MATDFRWRDGERTIRFGSGAAAEAAALLAEHGFDELTLLTTDRARAAAPAVADAAAAVLTVPAGLVDEISAALLPEAGGRPLVGLGGGRVVDTAKAIAGATGQRAAAIPTTLSGAELTPFHRTPAGVADARLVRPALVVADPALMASQPSTQRVASAINALAHALEALYTPLANPVSELAALRAASLLARGIEGKADEEIALGALLAGYASGCSGAAFHHGVCQTIVRTAGTPHAETNAVMLPHTSRLMVARAPGELGSFAAALGDPDADPAAAPGRIARLAAHSGHTRLGPLGVGEEHVEPVVSAALRHPLLANTPDPPGEVELRELVVGAL